MLPEEKRINSKKELKDWLSYEKSRYNLKHEFLNIFFNVGEFNTIFKLQKLLRKTEYYKNTNKKIRFRLSFFRLLHMENRYAMHIPLNCCGRGLKLMHLGPVLMHPQTTIGENCSIHFCTSFVAGGRNDEAPTVGDNCVIGVSSVVLGGVRIADGVAVGANAVVNKDVTEEDIAVAGVPAKKISNNGKKTWNKSKTDI